MDDQTRTLVCVALAALAIGCFIRLYWNQRLEIKGLREQLAEKESKQAPQPMQLPMPGFTVRVARFDLGDHEWIQQLYADETYPGPIPTHAELQDALFAEIERLGIKIPE